MPSFIACSICHKSGSIIMDGMMQECPCCGTSARKRLNVPNVISQVGWTTKEGVNNYYTQLASNDADVLYNQKSNQFIAENAGMSNRMMKKRLRQLHVICLTVARAKYPFITE